MIKWWRWSPSIYARTVGRKWNEGCFCKKVDLTSTKWNETESNFAFLFYILLIWEGAYALNAPTGMYAAGTRPQHEKKTWQQTFQNDWAPSIALLREETSSQKRSRMARVFQKRTALPAAHAFIHDCNEPYIALTSQPKLVLICRPRMDGRLSWLKHYNDE